MEHANAELSDTQQATVEHIERINVEREDTDECIVDEPNTQYANAEYAQESHTENEARARSEAITLIRARTLTRFFQHCSSHLAMNSSEQNTKPVVVPVVSPTDMNPKSPETGDGLTARQRRNKRKNEKKKSKGKNSKKGKKGKKKSPAVYQERANSAEDEESFGFSFTSGSHSQDTSRLASDNETDFDDEHSIDNGERIVFTGQGETSGPSSSQSHSEDTMRLVSEAKTVTSGLSTGEKAICHDDMHALPAPPKRETTYLTTDEQSHDSRHADGLATQTTNILPGPDRTGDSSNDASRYQTFVQQSPEDLPCQTLPLTVYSPPVAQRNSVWQLDSVAFECEFPNCNRRCNSWDGVSEICPRCGPYSPVRYCSREHLYGDVKLHWSYCGTLAFQHPCVASSIPRSLREGLPLMPNRNGWDSPERQRQALYFYHSTTTSDDYFIFSDWEEFAGKGLSPAEFASVRCSTTVLCTVRFDDPVEKDRFRRILAVALFGKLAWRVLLRVRTKLTMITASLEMSPMVEYMFRLIRDNLRARGLWSTRVQNAVMHQMLYELSITISMPWTGERHACETEWDGRNPRHCRDPVCRGEYSPAANDYGIRRGYRQLCDLMESSYWILRAARQTHPSVPQAAARIHGEGYEDVVDEDRRGFCRGEGWEGVGSGELELEEFCF